MSIVITPFDGADPAAIDQAYRIGSAANDADLPDFPPFCRQRFVASIHHPFPGNAPHRALAHVDGVPAGYLALDLPQLDNTDNATAELVVHPDQRRRGVGRALHAYAVEVLRRHGRRWLTVMTCAGLPGGPERSPAGTAFAAAMGATPALAEVRRRLDLRRSDLPDLDELTAAALPHAAGYRAVHWRNHAPEEYLADLAYLDGRLMTDAPLGDLAWEPELVDVERIQGNERAQDARGRQRYHYGMVHEATGRLVAWTTIDVAPLRWHAFQQITIVDPDHRGRRLGLLTKAGNLRFALAHEPELRVIDTWNAASNRHMIAVNEQLGYRPVDAWTDWQLDL
jgi:GNAT superfamily N-acetyltransferase